MCAVESYNGIFSFFVYRRYEMVVLIFTTGWIIISANFLATLVFIFDTLYFSHLCRHKIVRPDSDFQEFMYFSTIKSTFLILITWKKSKYWQGVQSYFFEYQCFQNNVASVIFPCILLNILFFILLLFWSFKVLIILLFGLSHSILFGLGQVLPLNYFSVH